ncbi:MAG: DNA-directed RNA polymerase subunit K [Candidatus Micrarchaeia archaeon]
MDYSEFTKFEIARLIGARALQLSMGAPPMIELPNNTFEPSAIAKLEFEKGVIPLTVYRPNKG